MILTNQQLVELTGGLKQGAARRRWTRKKLGIETPVKIDGHPMALSVICLPSYSVPATQASEKITTLIRTLRLFGRGACHAGY
ncbi:hypothetical protein [Cupriavidus lacunae]|uniref:hypothetical protein n=1 Tax=Cupriavidus lacunae TaxID=2666307 RepID=UPI00142DFC1C|nr:hypothetical protein [Cupriavidus lacunae]